MAFRFSLLDTREIFLILWKFQICISNFLQKLGKDPTVDTSFLPDRDREEEENRFDKFAS